MKHYKKSSTMVLDSITCNCCKKAYTIDSEPMEFYEFISIEHRCGYGAILGDGNKLSMDLCQYCFKNICGKYILEESEDTKDLINISLHDVQQKHGAAAGILANIELDSGISEFESLSDAIDDIEPLASKALNCLQALIKRTPELRLGQLLINAITPHEPSKLFYMSDKELFEKIKALKVK
tara:strand:- start:400 stop:942 length:543 start_codon:yes stop_codon:yes gene_type:complete